MNEKLTKKRTKNLPVIIIASLICVSLGVWSVSHSMRIDIYSVFLLLAVLGIFSCLIFFIMDKEKDKFEERYHENTQQAIAQKVAFEKEQFLSRISHDIRTQLNGIIGMQYLALQHQKDCKAVQADLYSIGTSANYLLGILDNSIDMTSMEKGQMKLAKEPLSLALLLDEVCQMEAPLAQNKGIPFCMEKLEDCYPHYLGDQFRIKQVLVNLLNSMLDLTPPQGKVNTTKKITSAKDQDIVEITISSTLKGYREEEIKELIQPSVSNGKTEGKIIAITIANNLIGMMGGKFTYASKEEEGFSFIIILPLTVADRKQDAIIDSPVQDKDLSCLEGKNILLAEDHQLSSIIVTRVLTPLGLNVELAKDGTQALTLFKKSEAGYYNMILMDIQMPGLNGLQASREIRNCSHPDAKSIPIVAMSASVFPKDKEESREAGMYEHLAKPIEVGKLKQVLYKYLH